MGNAARYVIVTLVAALVAVTAVWATREVARPDREHEGRLHAIMHERLNLDARQDQRIDQLEADFADRRKELEAELAAANADLAKAVVDEHRYGPAVDRAVDRAHMAMGKLQKATLEHVFEMRAELRPDQARLFDEAVAEALTPDAQD